MPGNRHEQEDDTVNCEKLQHRVSVSTQKQALNALAFLFREVWNKQLGNLKEFTRSKRPKHLPTVLSQEEVRKILDQFDGKHRLMAGLMYGGGLRLMECLTLRILDIDFDYHQLLIRNAKGFKDRVAPLPKRYTKAIRQQIKFHHHDLHPRPEYPRFKRYQSRRPHIIFFKRIIR